MASGKNKGKSGETSTQVEKKSRKFDDKGEPYFVVRACQNYIHPKKKVLVTRTIARFQGPVLTDLPEDIVSFTEKFAMGSSPEAKKARLDSRIKKLQEKLAALEKGEDTETSEPKDSDGNLEGSEEETEEQA